MIERIRLLLETLNLTASQFADEINVQRSGVSHIMSGRNKASLEFIKKILDRYPEISPDWLISGKGPMYRHAGKKTENTGPAQQSPPQQEAPKGLFDFENETSKDSTAQVENANKEPEKEVAGKNTQNSINHQSEKEIERLIILYKDGSFKDYFPE